MQCNDDFFNIGDGSFYNNKEFLDHFDICEVMREDVNKSE
jgi:hypothetical protein